MVKPREHLVVVLPGIGGSRLVSPRDPSSVVWDARPWPDVTGVLWRPETLSLAKWPVLAPAGLVSSKKPIIDGYEGLLNGMAGLPGVVLDDGSDPTRNAASSQANLVAVGYDFRLGVVHAAETLEAQIRPRLKSLWPDGRWEGRLIFVCHSMGGLVARFWLAQDGNAELCRELITLGTPHRGAPLALDWLANGVPVMAVHRFTGQVRELLRSWQGMYDLLPTGKDVATSWESQATATWTDAYGLPIDWEAPLASKAHSMQATIRQAWDAMPACVRPSVQPRVGYGHGTLRQCRWDGQKVLVSKAESGKGLVGWDQDLGDGTVPALNAVPREMPNPPLEMRVAFKHGLIMNLPEVLDRLESAEGHPLPRYVEGADQGCPAVLGVDHDELSWAGEPNPVRAIVRGFDIGDEPGSCSVTVRADESGGRSPIEVALEWDTETRGFVGEIPPSDPGSYTVRFDWEGSDHLSTSSSLTLLDSTDGRLGAL